MLRQSRHWRPGAATRVNDILTYSHASGTHAATFEVLSVNGSNQPDSLRIINGGAFGRRVSTISGTLVSGGSGYPNSTTVLVEIDEGHVADTDFKQRCKLEATMNGSGVVTSVSIFEGGGNYEGGTDPDSSSTTTVIDGSTGSGLIVNVTAMQAITGTSGISLTGGSGTGATANITLAETGWHALRDDHDYSFNSLTDEKQVVLQGTVTGGTAPKCGFVTWTDILSANTYYGTLLIPMDTYNDGLALASQVGVNSSSDVPSANGGSYVASFNEAEDAWLSIDSRSIRGMVKLTGTTVTSYCPMYHGLLDPFGTTTEAPYPFFHMGGVSGSRTWRKASTSPTDITGMTEVFRNSNRTSSAFMRRVADGTYVQVNNATGTAFPMTGVNTRCVFPIGAPALAGTGDDDDISESGAEEFFDSIASTTGAAATTLLKPAPGDDSHDIWPAVIELRVSKTAPIEFGPGGRLTNVYWCSGTKTDGTTLGAEDTLRDATNDALVYRVFPNGVRTEPYSFMCMQEGV